MPEKERRSYENYMENLRYKRRMKETQRWEGYLEGEAEGYQRGKEEGKEKGRKEGEQAAQLKLAKKRLHTSNDDKSISELTELAIDVIRKLREEKSVNG
jgi:flagellar biosynthesis/type III secretory pathway protein FliH